MIWGGIFFDEIGHIEMPWLRRFRAARAVRTCCMSPLVRLALEVLDESSAPPGIRSVAGATLLAAFSAGVEIPEAAPMVVWRWLLSSGGGASALHTHELVSAEVAKDALRILTVDSDAGEDARDLALATLRGENLAAVTDADLVLLSERAADEGRARRFVYLIEGVHELRGLSPDFLRILRDRLALSPSPTARAAAVEVGALLPRVDGPFCQRMLLDLAPVVRRTVVEHLERTDGADRDVALVVVRDHLAHEGHRSVIAAAFAALGGLMKAASGKN